jgi:HTH domain
MGRNTELARQWKVLQRIAAARGNTIPRLAEDLEVSTRTIRRDLDALDASASERQALTDAIQAARQEILQRHAPDGFNIGVNVRVTATRGFHDGTPRGLSRCGTRGDWKGVCLDPSERFAGQVMVVHCYCGNHNHCTRCYRPLYERRLNANYYDPHDRGIWHVPGFCGLDHRCPAREHSSLRMS